MKRIKLTQGKYALVDDEDFERVNQFKWTAYLYKNAYRAARKINYNNKRTTILMHQFIMGTLGRKHRFVVDHINGDTLDNRKENLRICTSAENGRNRKIHRDNTSGYKGVSFKKDKNKYQCHIRLNGKLFYLGYFKTAIEAAKVYNAKAIELHGEFARLNIIEALHEQRKQN